MFKKIEVFDVDNKLVDVISDELDKKCRSCIKNDGVINLLTAKHKEISLKEMFVMFSLPVINVSDRLPQKICGFCAKTLIEFYSFKLQTEQVQLMLQMAVGHQSQSFPIDSKVNNSVNNGLTKVNGVHPTHIKSNGSVIESNRTNSENKQVYTCSDCQLPYKNYEEYVSHRMKVLEKQSKEREAKSDQNLVKENKSNIELVTIEIEDDMKFEAVDHSYSKPNTPDEKPKLIKTNLKSKCVVCNLEFETIEEYLAHKRDTYRRHTIQCNLCNKRISPHKMEQHKLQHAQTRCRLSDMLIDPETGELSCSICKTKFDTRLRYLLHKRCKSKQLQAETLPRVKSSIKKRKPQVVKKYPCPICEVPYASSILKDHINTHTQAQPYMCEICGKKFRFKSNFRSHKHISALCDLCGAILSSVNGLRKHMRMKHSNMTYSCDKCQKIFQNKVHLNAHLKRHTGERPYLCTTCGKTFVQLTHLRTHMKALHSGETNFYCSKCNKRFQNGKEHKCNGRFNLYKKCHICYGFVVDMEKHSSLHNEGYEYICGFCNVTFIDKSSLKSHKTSRVCRRKLEFNCSVCSKPFHAKSLLKIHMRSHTGERPYKCEECGKRFLQFAHLHYHLKLHTGEKQYECPYCGKRFVLNGNLTQHLRTHTGEKPHVCDYCWKAFPTSSSLKKHRSIHLKYNAQEKKDW